MKEDNKGDKLQSRREFFKTAAKGVLPILGMAVLSSSFASCGLFSKDDDDKCSDCQANCNDACVTSCTGGCNASCKSGCKKGCQGCTASCKISCSSKCTYMVKKK